jgi:hypothetical protein
MYTYQGCRAEMLKPRNKEVREIEGGCCSDEIAGDGVGLAPNRDDPVNTTQLIAASKSATANLTAGSGTRGCSTI